MATQLPAAKAAVPNITASAKLAYARLLVSKQTPYFTTALLALTPREVPRGTLNTVGVTKRGILLWDADAVDRWTVQETAAVLVHELGHILNDHACRCARAAMDPRKYNRAGDRAINGPLKEAGYALPESSGRMPCYPEDVGLASGLTAEEYYAADKTEPEDQAPGAGAGRCGSGGGWAVDNEPDDPNDPAARSQADLGALRTQTAEAIRAHQASAGHGKMPAAWARWADDALAPPKIPWQQRLAVLCRQAVASRVGNADRTFSKVNRRQGGIGYGPGKPVLRGTHSPVPRVGFAIDTSGSVGHKELVRAASEAKAVLTALGGVSMHFISCDATIHGNAQVRTLQEVLSKIGGGGGTDFRPVQDAFAADKPAPPDIVIFVTDGCGPAYARAPKGSRYIWLLTGPYRQHPEGYDDADKHVGPITYGEFVEVDDDANADPAAQV